MGVTHVHGRPPLPGEQQLQGVRERRRARSATRATRPGPYATNAEPYDGRPGVDPGRLQLPGRQARREVVDAGRRAAQGGQDRQPRPAPGLPGGADHARRARARGRRALPRRRRQPAAAARAGSSCVAGNAIETARLLLLSASPLHPDGLANSSGQVGRNYMRHVTGSVYARFDKPVHMYRGETMAGVVADEARPRPRPRLRRRLLLRDARARPAVPRRVRRARRPGARSSPRSWTPTRTPPGCGSPARTCRRRRTGSRSTRPSTDQHGLPVPNVHFDDHPNDVAMRDHAWAQGEAMYEAVGATGAHRTHAVPVDAQHGHGADERPPGGRRRRTRTARRTTCRTCSSGTARVFTTGAAANPTLTIVALAIREAEHIGGEIRAGRF